MLVFFGLFKKAVVRRNSQGQRIGSKIARKVLRQTIRSKTTLHVKRGLDLAGEGWVDPQDRTTVYLNNDIIQVHRMGLSSDLNQNTISMGMTFFHELGHSIFGLLLLGSFKNDPESSFDNNNQSEADILPNQIGVEMGADWG